MEVRAIKGFIKTVLENARKEGESKPSAVVKDKIRAIIGAARKENRGLHTEGMVKPEILAKLGATEIKQIEGGFEFKVPAYDVMIKLGKEMEAFGYEILDFEDDGEDLLVMLTKPGDGSGYR